jgi:predicted enzyme related to lactoylglutathione lyase
MTITLQYTFLEVDDHEAALTFYRDVLGLEVRNDVNMEFGRWLTVGPKDQPEIGIVLQSVGVARPPADAQSLRELQRGLRVDPRVRRRGDAGAHGPAARST